MSIGIDVKGIDFAWSKPTPEEVHAAGAEWVAGYISHDPTKDLTRPEIQEYVTAGIPVVLVFETTTTRALTAGFAGGQEDGTEAANRLHSFGHEQPVYFAVDNQANWDQVSEYFRGIRSTFPPYLTGAYGGIQIADGAHASGIRYVWQTPAWSAGQWSQWATIRQDGGTLLGGAADWDQALTTVFGQWGTGQEYPANQPPVINGGYDVISEDDIARFWNYPMANQFRIGANGQPNQTPAKEFLIYGDHHFDELYGAISGLSAMVERLTQVVENMASKDQT